MTIPEILLSGLTVPITTFLLKTYLQLPEPLADISANFAELAADRIPDAFERDDTEQEFKRIAKLVVRELQPLFEEAVSLGQVNTQAVILQLQETLTSDVDSRFFLERNLDPAQITAAFRQLHPLPPAQLSSAETALYNRALDETVRYLVTVIAKLPTFQQEYAAVSLQRLGSTHQDVQQALKRVTHIEKMLVGDEKDTRYEADYRQALIRHLDKMELFGVPVPEAARSPRLSVAYVSLNLQHQEDTEEERKARADSELKAIDAEIEEMMDARTRSIAESLDAETERERRARMEPMLAALRDEMEKIRKERSEAVQKALTEDVPVKQIVRAESVLSDLTPNNGRLLIRGAAGSGKSTLFRWIAITAAGFQNHNEAEWSARVPFLLRLRECPNGRLPSPEALPEFIAREDGAPPDGWVKKVLDDGRALLLLDGVDEVPKLHRDQLLLDLQALVERYGEEDADVEAGDNRVSSPDPIRPKLSAGRQDQVGTIGKRKKNLFFVSTRPTAVPEDCLKHLGFREAAVEPMTEGDRRQFILKWHEAVGRELQDRGRPDLNLPVLAEKLIKELPWSPAVGMSSTPLLCALLCSMHWENDGQLPTNQVELFENTCHMLLHTRERNSIPPIPIDKFPPAYRALEYTQKRLLVRAIAHYMVLNNETSAIDYKQALVIVAKELKSIPYPAGITDLPSCVDERAKQVIEWLIERCGMLREMAPGQLDFIHNAIKEYLAADYFVESDSIGLLVKNIEDPTWQPVLLFAAGLGKQTYTDDLIRKLLNPTLIKPWATAPRLNRIYAVLCGAMVKQLDPALKSKLDELQPQSLLLQNTNDAELMAKAGNRVLRYLSFDATQSATQQAACVRALRIIGTPEAKQLIEGYLEVEAKEVVTELLEVVYPLRITAVQAWLSHPNLTQAEWRRRIDDLTPLQDLTNIKALHLAGTQVSDLTPLQNLTNLERLDLSGTQVRDLTPLRYLQNLQTLYLIDTKVSDVTPLKKLTKLKILYLTGSPVSDVTPLNHLANLRIMQGKEANNNRRFLKDLGAPPMWR